MESKRQKSRSEERGPKENEGPEGPEEVAGAEVVFFSFSGSLSHGSLKNKKIKKKGGPRRGPGGPQKVKNDPHAAEVVFSEIELPPTREPPF